MIIKTYTNYAASWAANVAATVAFLSTLGNRGGFVRNFSGFWIAPGCQNSYSIHPFSYKVSALRWYGELISNLQSSARPTPRYTRQARVVAESPRFQARSYPITRAALATALGYRLRGRLPRPDQF